MRWLLLSVLLATPALAKPHSNCKERCAQFTPMCEGQCKEVGKGKHIKECNAQCAKMVVTCENECEKKQKKH